MKYLTDNELDLILETYPNQTFYKSPDDEFNDFSSTLKDEYGDIYDEYFEDLGYEDPGYKFYEMLLIFAKSKSAELISTNRFLYEQGQFFDDGDFIDECISAIKFKIKPNGKVKWKNNFSYMPSVFKKYEVHLNDNDLRELLKISLRITCYKLKDGTIINRKYVDEYHENLIEEFEKLRK